MGRPISWLFLVQDGDSSAQIGDGLANARQGPPLAMPVQAAVYTGDIFVYVIKLSLV